MRGREGAEGVVASASCVYPMAYSTPLASAFQRAIPPTGFAVVLRNGVVLVRRARPPLAGPSKGWDTGSTLRAWALWLILLCGWPARAYSDEVVVVVNPAAPAGPGDRPKHTVCHFRHAAARLGGRYANSRVRAPGQSAVHVMFCKQILGVFPHQYRTAWDRLVYSGTGQAPLEVESEEEMRRKGGRYRCGAGGGRGRSEEEMREKLARNAGAIGYLSRKMIDESVRCPAGQVETRGRPSTCRHGRRSPWLGLCRPAPAFESSTAFKCTAFSARAIF